MHILSLLPLVSVACCLQHRNVDQQTFMNLGGGLPSLTGHGNEFRLMNEMNLPNGKVKQRYEQFFNGIRVLDTAVVATSTNHGPADAQGVMYDIPETSSLMELDRITADEAIKSAEEYWCKKNNVKSIKPENIHVELVVDHHAGVVYWINFFVDVLKPSRPFFYVDVNSGKVVDMWEGLDAAVTAQGEGPGGNKKTGKYMFGSGTNLGSLNITRNGNKCYMENSWVKTVNLNGKTSGPNRAHEFTCPENTVKPVNDAFSPINDAHYYGTLLYRMYTDWVNISPLTFQLILRVHYSKNYENAFWDGTQMTFGDGATTFYPLVDINVVTHEAAHGFTEQNSNLIYRYMSGGMNEAYSDMAGEAAEFYSRGKVDWTVGSDIFKRQGAALRYFDNPEKDGRSIGHASKYTVRMDVHHSSGVYNKAYYLLATTAGWDVKMAFQVFTAANRLYWTASSTFDQGACGVVRAGKDLGFNETDIVSAFNIVGVKSTCQNKNCKDKNKKCAKKKKAGRCWKSQVQKVCAKTCDACK